MAFKIRLKPNLALAPPSTTPKHTHAPAHAHLEYNLQQLAQQIVEGRAITPVQLQYCIDYPILPFPRLQPGSRLHHINQRWQDQRKKHQQIQTIHQLARRVRERRRNFPAALSVEDKERAVQEWWNGGWVWVVICDDDQAVYNDNGELISG